MSLPIKSHAAQSHAVHFGAGNIGRGLVADLLHDSGYHVTFLDVSSDAVEEINSRGGYLLRHIEHDYQEKIIDDVNAISTIEQPDRAVEAIVDADIITTSVWANNLGRIAPLIAKGLLARKDAQRPRINVLACENAMFASTTLRQEILNCEPEIDDAQLDKLAAFPNTAVDRVVLGHTGDGAVTVDIADYLELAVERPALVDPDQPPIKGAEYVPDLEPYLVRKLYIVNCGHLWAGLLGLFNGISNVREVFTSKELVKGVREAMAQSAAYIGAKYDFTPEELAAYVDLSVHRYQIEGVDYDTTMITRSPIRKLSPDDRFVGPARGCEEYGLPNDRILEGIALLMMVDRETDDQAVELQARIASNGPEETLEHYAGINRGTRIHSAVMQHYAALQMKYGQ